MAKYTVKWGFYQEHSHECDLWQQALDLVFVKRGALNLTVVGKDYDVGGPDERVHSGLTEDEELELEELLA